VPLGTITAVVPNVAFAHALFAFTVVVTFVFTGGVLAETSGPARVTRTLPRHTDTVFGTVLWAKAGVAIWPSPIRKAFHPILPIVQQHPVHDVSRGAIVARPTGVATAIAFHSACAVARAFIGATFHRATFPDPPGPAIAVARG